MSFSLRRGTAWATRRWVLSVGLATSVALALAPSAWAFPIPVITGVTPNHGPASGGTEVIISGTNFVTPLQPGQAPPACWVCAVKFGTTPATSFALRENPPMIGGYYVVAVSPPGAGTVDVKVLGASGLSEITPADHFTYDGAKETTEYKNWVLSGGITDKKQGQAITLPEGATFNGHGEVNTETGAGSVTGNISVPPFNTTLDLFDVLPVTFGLNVSPSGPVEGSVAKSETVPGDETLTIPLKLGIGVTSLSVMGLTIPTSCTTSEGESLALADNLTREELLSKGWSFAGSTTLPRFQCEGPYGGIVGVVLTLALSGPENPYSISMRPPGG